MHSGTVITGIGAVTPLGIGPDAFWDGLRAGRSAFGRTQRFDSSAFPSALTAEVRDLKVRDLVPKSYRKAVKVMARDSELAVAAAQIAACDAGVATRGSAEPAAWATGDTAFAIETARAGCQIGAGLIAADAAELTAALATAREDDGSFSMRRWGTEDGGDGGINNLPPLWMLKYLPNMLACHVTIVHGLEGPSNTVTCAEASALLSLGEAARVIERGDAEVCFAGGAESKINHMGMLRMTFAKRLAPTGDATPEEAWRLVRPYDDAATGSLLGEAGVICVLETEEHAQRRGAPVRARVEGFGAGQSVEGIFGGVFEAMPEDPTDYGLVRAIKGALDDAGIEPTDIDAIAPGALGVPHADLAEEHALRAVFGERLADLPMITTTPNVGVSAAATSGVQAAAAALALAHGELPARVHAGRPRSGLLAGAHSAVSVSRLNRVLVCSTALGGQSAAMVLAQPR